MDFLSKLERQTQFFHHPREIPPIMKGFPQVEPFA